MLVHVRVYPRQRERGGSSKAATPPEIRATARLSTAATSPCCSCGGHIGKPACVHVCVWVSMGSPIGSPSRCHTRCNKAGVGKGLARGSRARPAGLVDRAWRSSATAPLYLYTALAQTKCVIRPSVAGNERTAKVEERTSKRLSARAEIERKTRVKAGPYCAWRWVLLACCCLLVRLLVLVKPELQASARAWTRARALSEVTCLLSDQNQPSTRGNGGGGHAEVMASFDLL